MTSHNLLVRSPISVALGWVTIALTFLATSTFTHFCGQPVAGASKGGDLGGWRPAFAEKKTKNWDILVGKIVKFHKNTKFGAYVGHFFQN